MKNAFLLLLFVSGISFYSANAQTTTTTTTATASGSSLSDRITGKWAYEGTEEFGVVTPPDSTQKKDWIQFTADNKYSRVQNGKAESGTYKITVATRQIFLSNDDTKKTTMYKIKLATATNIILDYQTPDLVHTLYHFKKAQ